MNKSREELRIGVFICRCGNNIGGVIDVPKIVEYAKTQPNVVHTEENPYTCSSEGLSKIKEAIVKHNLNRVVVASCTPRTHEPLFRATCEEAGLNRYLFEMANIREHCSWAHMHEPEKATESAKEIVRIAIAKVRFLEPLEEPKIEITPSTLIIGAGISGLTAALSLSEQGFNVYILEKEAEAGGLLRKLHTLFPSGQDALDFIESIIEIIKVRGNINLLTSTVLKEVKGYLGNFEIIALQNNQREVRFKVGTIIVSTGALPLEPTGLYGYGKFDNIMTQLEFEQLLKNGLEEKVEKVVMIQCVGAREEKGITYCSRICCKVALKNALCIKELNSNIDVYILYRDLEAYGREYVDYYQKAQEQGIKFIRYRQEKPPNIIKDSDRKLKVGVFSPIIGKGIDIICDLVVLSTPLIHHQAGRDLSQILKVTLGSSGFFQEVHPKLRPVDFASEGIFLCGTAHGPKDIEESMAQALAAASKASIPMAKGIVKTEAVKAVVDKELCVGCGACVAVCPYNAIDWLSFGQPRIIEANCMGCGLCAAECPMGAMQLKHYQDNQLVPMINTLFESEKASVLKDEPSIVCFACRWCAYAAADTAGVMRLQYPCSIRIILVPCSGRVDAIHILTAFSRDADGVMVAGCLKDGCHYIDGNIKAERRVNAMKKALEVVGIEGDRVEMFFLSAGMPDKFVESVINFTDMINKLPRMRRTVRKERDLNV